MKVTCKANNLNDISNADTLERLKKYILKPDGDVDLDVGREYRVYGILFWDNCPWYYICPEDYDEYPKPFASDFFEIVDEQLSTYWKLSSIPRGKEEASTSLVFDEWAKDSSFYERLIEGDPDAVAQFSKYRSMMDKE